MTLVLASASSIRTAMLTAAGVSHQIDPGQVDESALKHAYVGDDADLATALAEAKAIDAGHRHTGSWVIGGDSLVSVDGRRFDKPTSRAEAVEHLRFFSGRNMRLTSAVVLALDGRIDWAYAGEALLDVRPLSDDFIHTYLEAEWPAVAQCVGVFRMEGRGVTLFDQVVGDHFTILGMPLLPLLAALRERKIDGFMTSSSPTSHAIGYAEVIGDPIAQSKSPAIHQFWLKALGMDGEYRAHRVTRAELPAYFADRVGDPAWRGCNVTMPLKLDALMLADKLTDRATAAGAANLLVPRDGQLIAENTDVGAVLDLVAPMMTAGRADSITLLGTGGAARAVLLALRTLGAESIILQARDMAEATSLAIEFRLQLTPRRFDTPVDSKGLINATPLGMAGFAPTRIDISLMPVDGWLLDLVSNPLPTPLWAAATGRGLTTIDGLSVLVEQAAASFVLLFGQKPPRDRDGELFAMLRAS